MYTSGSTGVPKGVLVPHRAINRLAINNGYADILPSDCLAHGSNPAFDAATFEVWGAWLNGASLLVIPQETLLDPKRLVAELRRGRVSVLWLTTALFIQYVDVLSEVLRSLRHLIIGGEVVDPKVIERVMKGKPPQRLLNAYGPTECTTFSTTHLVSELPGEGQSVPIGRPIANAQIYLLDRWLQPVPVETAGEIYIGGDGIAQGYWNRPDLTAERFVADPFGQDSGARLYKTGDLGRWRRDGELEFLGRNDDQVKIRGFRIELGEIEARLRRHPRVQEAIVLALENTPGQKHLVAYWVPRPHAELNAESLRTDLKATLPEYMLPSAFVRLPGFPLNANGKIDKRALPAPDSSAYVHTKYEAPEGAIEETVAQIWQELLKVERIGRHDNFFELGGHSLLATRMLGHLNEVLELELPLRVLFEKPTVQQMAAVAMQEIASEIYREVS
jgi:acyl-coenzyme A synthetase/AMP-(fatty) acid ligase/acyl carrier protein